MPVLAGALAAAAVLSVFGAFRPRDVPIVGSAAGRDRSPSAPGRRANRRRLTPPVRPIAIAYFAFRAMLNFATCSPIGLPSLTWAHSAA